MYIYDPGLKSNFDRGLPLFVSFIIEVLRATLAQSILRLATGWTTKVSEFESQ
jgi:hypothetical protein